MAPRKKAVTTDAPITPKVIKDFDPIVHVEGCLRAGPFSMDLGPKTLIVGPNGSGKTTRVNGITLSVLGIAQDVAGKSEQPDDAVLFRHLSHNGQPVTALARTQRGREFTYNKIEGKSEDGMHLPKASHSAALPLATLGDALTGSNQTVRKWVLDAAGRWITHDVLKSVIASLGMQGFIGEPSADVDPVSWLLAAETAAADVKLTATRAKATAEMAIHQIQPSAGLPVTDAEIEAARGGVTQTARQEGITHNERAQLTTERGAVENEHGQVVAAYNTASGERQQASAMIEALAQEIAQTPPRTAIAPDRAEAMRALVTFAKRHRDHYEGSCALCASTIAPEAMIPRLDMLIREIPAMLDAADPTADMRANLAQWKAQWSTADRAMLVAQERAAVLVARHGAIVARLALPDAEAAAAGMTGAQSDYDVLLRRKTLHDQLAQHRATVERATTAETDAARKVDAIKKVRETLMSTAANSLKSAVTKYLPDGWKFDILMEDTSIRLGLILPDGNGFRSAISGAQEAALYSAIACALSTGDVCMVIPAERQWSPEMLATVMKGLANAPAQVILVSTVMPAGKVAKSVWTVIETVEPKIVDAGDNGADDGDSDDGTDDLPPEAGTIVAPQQDDLAARARSLITPSLPTLGALAPLGATVPPVTDPASDVPWMPSPAMPNASVEDINQFFRAQGVKEPEVLHVQEVDGAPYSLLSDGSVIRMNAQSPFYTVWLGIHKGNLDRFVAQG